MVSVILLSIALLRAIILSGIMPNATMVSALW
jgi:hypothetical protein